MLDEHANDYAGFSNSRSALIRDHGRPPMMPNRLRFWKETWRVIQTGHFRLLWTEN
jgi:hypothetical protein